MNTSTLLRLLPFRALFLLGCCYPVAAVDLKVDFNQRSAANNVAANTESGFTPMVITTAASGVIPAATVNSLNIGPQTVSIKGTGTINYDDRKRSAPVNAGSFTQQALLQDFIFALYSAANPDAGLDVTISGLAPGKDYAITLWSYDNSSAGTRVSDWSANGVLKVNNYTFNGSVLPTSNTQYQVNFDATADGAGKVVISGRRDVTSVDSASVASHGVFLNALWIRDLFVDTDNDGMGDGWETAHGLTVGVNDSALDPDGDLLTNFQEYLADTDPQDADTDNDGLADGVETKTGTWVSVTNTGTNPLLADTDADGLNDAIENPSLPTQGPSQPGTNPNVFDTDSDLFSDGEEVLWPSNPTSNADFPNPAAGAVLAVDMENTAATAQTGFQPFIGPGTTAAISNLSTAYGPYTVTVTAVGSTTLESRDRAAAAGGNGFNPMFRDFIFAAGSDADGDGMDITITGLAPLTWYPVMLWSWDPSSTATPRHSTWLASDGDNPPAVKIPVYSLEGATLPASASDRRLRLDALTTSAGTLVIQGRKETGYTASINVFLNGLVIGAPVTPPRFLTQARKSFSFTSDGVGNYEILGSSDLIQWTSLGNVVTNQPRAAFYSDPSPEGPRQFYQVRRLSPP